MDNEEDDFIEIQSPDINVKKFRCFYCETIILPEDLDTLPISITDKVVCRNCTVTLDPRQKKITDYFKR